MYVTLCDGAEWPPVASTVVVETWSGVGGAAGGGGGGKAHWSSRAARVADSDEASKDEPPSDQSSSALSGSSSAGSDAKHAVRVVFNGRVVHLPGCKGQEPLHRGGLCPLEVGVVVCTAHS